MNNGRSIGLVVLLFVGTVFASILIGMQIGSGESLLAVLVLGGIFAIHAVLNWRMVVLVVYPLFWAWTWVDLPFLGLSIERLLAIPAILGFLMEHIQHRRAFKLLPNRSASILLALTLLMVVSLGLNPETSGVHRLTALLQKMLWAYLLFDVLTETSEAQLRRFIRIMLFSTLLAALGGLLIVLLYGTSTRYTGILSGWEFLSWGIIGLNLTLPVAFYIFAEFETSIGWLRRVSLYTVFSICVFGAIISLVRRETPIIVAVSLAVLFFTGLRQNRRRSAFLLLLVLIVFFGLILSSHSVWQERFYGDLLGRSTITDEPRVAQWVVGLNAFLERPLTGYGIGSFRTVAPVYELELELFNSPTAPHNSFLAMLVELGIGGFLLLVALWIAFFGGVRQARHANLSPYMQQLVYATPAVMVYLLMRSFFGDAIRNNSTWTLFGLFWAIIYLAKQKQQVNVPAHATVNLHEPNISTAPQYSMDNL